MHFSIIFSYACVCPVVFYFPGLQLIFMDLSCLLACALNVSPILHTFILFFNRHYFSFEVSSTFALLFHVLGPQRPVLKPTLHAYLKGNSPSFKHVKINGYNYIICQYISINSADLTPKCGMSLYFTTASRT